MKTFEDMHWGGDLLKVTKEDGEATAILQITENPYRSSTSLFLNEEDTRELIKELQSYLPETKYADNEPIEPVVNVKVKVSVEVE
ncbi:hypothetical protein CON64_22680 [Bacillus pseudomycoides]|nr:hypothetical protein CON64_22680 [Bacillus pseudomycoides]